VTRTALGTADPGVIIGRRVQLDLPFLGAPQGHDVPQRAPAPRRPKPEARQLLQPTREYPAIEFVRMRRARRYILRVRPGGGLRVTIPRGGSRLEATRFVQRQAEWIQRERSRVLSRALPLEWRGGGAVLLRGEPVRLEVSTAEGWTVARYGERSVRVPAGLSDLRPYIEADLRVLARTELGARLRELAAAHGLAVTGMSVRNQKSRWGSCSRHGRIALNFRLVQMPQHVSDYVILHELMHLKQQNHSVRFWRLVENVCPDFRGAERWLKTDGRALF
jgi:predicted metal-dependent hydrolase